MKSGDTFTKKFTITDEMVRQFADVTGDHNLIHLDDEYAKTTRFGKRIAHGMLIAGLMSNIIGNEFPGNGSVIRSMNINFRSPVYVGSTIKIVCSYCTDEHKRKIVSCAVIDGLSMDISADFFIL